MNTSPLLEVAVPILSVEDLAGALDYYQRILGFQVGWTWGDPPHLASVCRDRVEINLGQRGKAGAVGPLKVFDDGPPPRGLRYCLKSESLVFTDAQDVASLADPAADRRPKEANP